MAKKLPNVSIEREAHKFSLQSLFWGKFSLRVVIGVRDVDNGHFSEPEWVIEIFAKEGDREWRVVPPGESRAPYWRLTDGGGGRVPYLVPCDTQKKVRGPSPRWTPALWRELAKQVAEEVGFDASNDSEADLDTYEDAGDVLLRVTAEACDPETRSQVS